MGSRNGKRKNGNKKNVGKNNQEILENRKLRESTKKLGDQNKVLADKNKSLEARITALEKVIREKDEEVQELANTAAVVQQTDAVTIRQEKFIEQIFKEMNDSIEYKTLNDHERLQMMIDAKKQLNDEELRYLKEEQEIYSNSPEAKETTAINKEKRWARIILLILGITLVIVGFGLLIYGQSIWIGMLSIAISGFFIVTSIGPTISPEETENIERLSKVFNSSINITGQTPENTSLPVKTEED
ncbi:MAG: hypothetical protein KDD61_14630 [Bdellovibrionales bacterium]|nr:hypothetical protein [Bdellovibrionales bacterium]